MSDTNITISETAKRLATALSEHKGEFISCEWQSEPTPLAKFKASKFRKTSKAVVQTGVSFANIKSVREGIENGERGEVGSLPSWQEWALFPFILRHKTKGTEYLRLTLVPSCKIESEYEIDGVKVDASTFYSMLPKQGDERPEILSVKVENIIRIG